MVTQRIAKQGISREVDHLVGCFCGDERGPTLIVVGSIHGNEPGGSRALRAVAGSLRAVGMRLRGRVYLIDGNVRALNAGVRFIDSDLNRHWTSSNLGKSILVRGFERAEDMEFSELLTIFREILRTAKDEVYVLDLHSTSATGRPSATVGDTLRNRHFAQKFPVTMILGIEEQLEGTMLEYLNNEGAVTLGFEGGQHDSSDTRANHEALIWLALVNSGIAAPDEVRNLETHRRNLGRANGRKQIIEIRHREAISPDDEFTMNPGFNNFDSVTRGQILARNRQGPIKAPETGLILMPLYQKKGEDGFFIGREVATFWIWLSAVLRRLRLADWMFILPGVSLHPTDPERLIVNTTIARFFPLQIFHLLGFRRRQREANYLIVSRRKFDRQSPFGSRLGRKM